MRTSVFPLVRGLGLGLALDKAGAQVVHDRFDRTAEELTALKIRQDIEAARIAVPGRLPVLHVVGWNLIARHFAICPCCHTASDGEVQARPDVTRIGEDWGGHG